MRLEVRLKMKKVKAVLAWMLVSDLGNPVTIDYRLPIYWLRQIAKDNLIYGKKIVRVEIKEIKRDEKPRQR